MDAEPGRHPACVRTCLYVEGTSSATSTEITPMRKEYSDNGMTNNRTTYTLQTNLCHLLREAAFSPMNSKVNHNVTQRQGHTALTPRGRLTVRSKLDRYSQSSTIRKTDFSDGFVHSTE